MNCLVYFFSKVLQFWILTFRPMIHFDSIFVKDVESSHVSISVYGHLIFQHNLKNRLSFSLGLLFDSLSKINQLTIFVWVYFGAPFSIQLNLYLFFCQYCPLLAVMVHVKLRNSGECAFLSSNSADHNRVHTLC